MKRPVYQQIAMELKDLRFQEALDREHGISEDFSITRDLARNINILVDIHLPPGTEFDFQESTVNRLVLETPTFIMTVEASLIHTYNVTTTSLADYVLMDHEVSRFRLALWKEVEA